MKRRLSNLLIVCLIIGFALHTSAAPTKNADPDKVLFDQVISELTCQCGCGLLVSACEPADCATSAEIRGKVRKLIAQGESDDQIKQAMVKDYGPQILAAPPKAGFNLSAYILPFAFLIIGGYVLLLIITRWLPKIRGANNEPIRAETVMESDENAQNKSGEIRHLEQIENELKKLDL